MVKNKLTADARQIALNILASNEKLRASPTIFAQNDRIIFLNSCGLNDLMVDK